MHDMDERAAWEADPASAGSSRSPVSVALMAAVACVPLVVAAGFLTDRSPPSPGGAGVPSDISVLMLRGQIDADPDHRERSTVRAGY